MILRLSTISILQSDINTKKIMKTFALSLLAVLALCCCGNNNKEQDNAPVAQEQDVKSIALDELLAKADSLTDQLVTVEGVCTHTCRHGARKIFLQGSDNTQTIRCEYEDHRPFSKECIHSVVRVSGYLRETRMDEAYLINWQTEYELAKAQNFETEDEETSTSASCATESAARKEQGSTVDEKIAHYRMLIAQRKEAEGKEYLSFYHLEATDYKIVE